MNVRLQCLYIPYSRLILVYCTSDYFFNLPMCTVRNCYKLKEINKFKDDKNRFEALTTLCGSQCQIYPFLTPGRLLK